MVSFSRKSLPPEKNQKLTSLAAKIHNDWEVIFPSIERSVQSRGNFIKCEENCFECCFSRKFCSLSEGLLIAEFMKENFSSELHEHFRLRVESNTSSLNKLREDGICDSESVFQRSGGMECPFLKNGTCAIYPVRPLECRTQLVESGVALEQCRQCSRSVCCIEAEAKNIQLQKELKEKEKELEAPSIAKNGERFLVSETLSYIWEHFDPPPTFQITEQSWEKRLRSRTSYFDQTWQDDRYDFIATTRFPLVLPEEGEYFSDLIVVKIQPEFHSIYEKSIKYDTFNELRVLYKLLPGGSFDWESRTFKIRKDSMEKESHIVWMGDSIQERLMMWEAAKRCRGKVLCGGLGMGIFPQFALSLPRVQSVHIVDMNEEVIELIKETWSQKSWPRQFDCKISLGKIENYLKTTKEKYDTVYIDTWDALTEEYLPHVNYLKSLAQKVLKPKGEIILWGFDLMVRLYLNQAKNIMNRREYFLKADDWQMDTLSKQLPMFHKLLSWFKENPDCTDEKLYSEAYRLVMTEKKNMGILSLNEHTGFDK